MTLSPEEFHPLIELMAEKACEGLLCLETDGRILYANEAAARTLAQPATGLVSRTIFEIAPEMSQSLWKELWKEIRERAVFAFEFSLSASAERVVPVEVTVHYLKPAARELACLMFRDVEERKRLKLLQEEFVSMASHELRTPMTVIREGVSQVLEGLRGDISETQRRALTIALNGIDRLGRIINELLDISKIESGKVSLKREWTDLTVLSREVAAGFQSQADDRGLSLRVTAPARAVTVYADKDRLVQVLTNLIGNAFKFTAKGRIDLEVSARDGEAECAVTDTGIGLVPEGLDRIFNKFEQLGQASVTGEKGTGLGLSISRGIIELHKGRIWVESAGRGCGTRVAFAIPSQTGREIFIEQVTPVLHLVARRGGSLSVVIFRLSPGASSSLKDLEILVRAQIARRVDILIPDGNVLYLALEGTVRREAMRLVGQITAALHEATGGKGDLSFSVASFPEEEANEDTFLSLAIARSPA